MNFVDPFRGDLTDTDPNDTSMTYTMGYYQIPDSTTGVTDTAYDEWVTGTSYSVGDYVKIDDLKAIYKSSADTNSGNYPPANSTVWTYWGPYNSYKMLAVDEYIGSQTTGTDCVFTCDFSKATAFAFVNIDFTTLDIEIVDNSDSSVVYTETITSLTATTATYYGYFYGNYSNLTRIYRGSLEWFADATITFTFTGEVSIGALVIGLEEDMGCTLVGTSLRFEDTSTITKSEVTGFRTVNRYGSVRVLNAKVLFDTDEFNNTAATIDTIIGRNILFVPTDDDDFAEMITIGYFEDIELPVENSTKMETQSTIIGVI